MRGNRAVLAPGGDLSREMLNNDHDPKQAVAASYCGSTKGYPLPPTHTRHTHEKATHSHSNQGDKPLFKQNKHDEKIHTLKVVKPKKYPAFSFMPVMVVFTHLDDTYHQRISMHQESFIFRA